MEPFFILMKFIVTKVYFNEFIFSQLCRNLYNSLSLSDRREINLQTVFTYRKFITEIHDTYGRHLRNELKLWDKSSKIVRWFKKTYDIDHADDISSLIIVGMIFRNNVSNREAAIRESVFNFKAHWEKYGEQFMSNNILSFITEEKQ